MIAERRPTRSVGSGSAGDDERGFSFLGLEMFGEHTPNLGAAASVGVGGALVQRLDHPSVNPHVQVLALLGACFLHEQTYHLLVINICVSRRMLGARCPARFRARRRPSTPTCGPRSSGSVGSSSRPRERASRPLLPDGDSAVACRDGRRYIGRPVHTVAAKDQPIETGAVNRTGAPVVVDHETLISHQDGESAVFTRHTLGSSNLRRPAQRWPIPHAPEPADESHHERPYSSARVVPQSQATKREQ